MAPVEAARRQTYGRRGHRRGSSVTRAPAWSAHRSSPLSLDAGKFTCLRTRPARGPHPPPFPSDTHGQKSTSTANLETGYNKARVRASANRAPTPPLPSVPDMCHSSFLRPCCILSFSTPCTLQATGYGLQRKRDIKVKKCKMKKCEVSMPGVGATVCAMLWRSDDGALCPAPARQGL